MNAKLLVVVGKTTKREVELKLPAVLGRSRQADVTVAHPLISRRHCEISENNGLLLLRDLASLNGTMIGGRRIEVAPLLPDAEFAIGTLTFRVLYEYDGDLESIPATRFAEEVQSPTEAGLGNPSSPEAEEAPMFEIDEALPAEPNDASSSSDLAMPDLMALADADSEEVLPAGAAGARWPSVAADKLPTVTMPNAPREPTEFDSSLQSGAHRQDSPWSAEPQAGKKRRHGPTGSAGKGPTALPETPPE